MISLHLQYHPNIHIIVHPLTLNLILNVSTITHNPIYHLQYWLIIYILQVLDLYISLLLLLVLYSYIIYLYTIIISNIEIVQLSGCFIFYEISVKKSLLFVIVYEASSLSSVIATTNYGFCLCIIGEIVTDINKLWPTSNFI